MGECGFCDTDALAVFPCSYCDKDVCERHRLKVFFEVQVGPKTLVESQNICPDCNTKATADTDYIKLPNHFVVSKKPTDSVIGFLVLATICYLVYYYVSSQLKWIADGVFSGY